PSPGKQCTIKPWDQTSSRSMRTSGPLARQHRAQAHVRPASVQRVAIGGDVAQMTADISRFPASSRAPRRAQGQMERFPQGLMRSSPIQIDEDATTRAALAKYFL